MRVLRPRADQTARWPISARNSSRVACDSRNVAEHRRRDHHRVLLLDAAHHHAQVARLDHHADAAWRRSVSITACEICSVRRSCSCSRRAYMSTSRASLETPNTLPVGNVADVAAAEERQHVVLAEAVHLDVLHDDHAVGLLREDRAVDQRVEVGAVAGREERERLGDAPGCAREPLAIGVLAERHQHLAHEVGEARDIDCASWRGRFRRRAAAGHQAMCTAAAPSGRRAASTLRAALTARSNSGTGSSKSATGPVTSACTSSSGARTNVCVPDLLANT